MPAMAGTLEAVELRTRELARRGRRGIPTIRALLDERLGRGRYTDSGFETRAVRMVRAAGLPDPVLQHTVRDGEFVAHLDLAWPDDHVGGRVRQPGAPLGQAGARVGPQRGGAGSRPWAGTSSR